MAIIDKLCSGPWALEQALAFTQARHRMLAENVANVDTPGYRTKQVDAGAFQNALKQALDTQKNDPSRAPELPSSEEFHTGSDGALVVKPSVEPPENVLFHDQTNGSIERQMAKLAENGMMHQALVELMRGYYAEQMKAINGRPT